jgi:esterase/lipase superfamily enzyme
LKDKIENGWLQLYCVDSIDAESLYCHWVHPTARIKRHIDFEKYILNEVIPFMHTKNTHDCLMSHGLSLGAFHAANIVFRHPQHFKKLVAFSGRYDLTLNVECFRDLFDGFYNEDIYFHTPTHYLPSLDCTWRLNKLREIDIILTIGREDPFLQNNEYLSSILSQKNIPFQMPIWDERAHSGYYWRRMSTLYL